MKHEPLPLPDACARTLVSIETDPLNPSAEAELHMEICTACSEARVIYLSQEELPQILAPAGYFDRLPGRVLGKLPARPALARHVHSLYWAAAATLFMAVGAGAFWAGRANRTPLVEATLPKSVDTIEITVADTPFRDRDEEAVQVQTLSPEELKALLKRLDESAPSQR